eukprot:m.42956 g.42956  ORF g.42956 m.42956 type:complete len:681 (-) comp9936_c0_seq1:28-2070(-)
MASNAPVVVTEREILVDLLDYLHEKGIYDACAAIERATSLSPAGNSLPPEVFLRDKILQGRYPDVLLFIDTLKDQFPEDCDKLRFLVGKQWFLELITATNKFDIELHDKDNKESIPDNSFAQHDVFELVACLKLLKTVSTDNYFQRICSLAGMADPRQERELREWNLYTSRNHVCRLALQRLTKILGKPPPRSLRLEESNRTIQALARACVCRCRNKNDAVPVSVVQLPTIAEPEEQLTGFQMGTMSLPQSVKEEYSRPISSHSQRSEFQTFRGQKQGQAVEVLQEHDDEMRLPSNIKSPLPPPFQIHNTKDNAPSTIRREVDSHERQNISRPKTGKRQPRKESLGRLRFQEISRVEDIQAIRTADFSPSGSLIVIGSNSATLRVCMTPAKLMNNTNQLTIGAKLSASPEAVWQRKKHHRGSIYCVRWNASGNLIATGSNDKIVNLQRFDLTNLPQDSELPTTLHPKCGTIRQISFVENNDRSEFLVTGGGGNFSLGYFDCDTGKCVSRLEGHTDTVHAVVTPHDTHSQNIVYSASADSTVKLWDLRTSSCVQTVHNDSEAMSLGSFGNSVAFGLEDGHVLLTDLRALKQTKFCMKVHTAEVKSLHFNEQDGSLLTGSYDGSVMMIPSQSSESPHFYPVARHDNKVIEVRWRPSNKYVATQSFLTCSADRTCRLWACLPS